MTNIEKLVDEALGFVSLNNAKNTKAVVVLYHDGTDERAKCVVGGSLVDTAKAILKSKRALEIHLDSILSTLEKYSPSDYEKIKALVEENASVQQA